LAGLVEGFQKEDSIGVGVEDGLATVAAVHHMVNGPRILYSELSRHTAESRVQQSATMSSTVKS
jgi:succinate dehydrogenase/fumarate reductase cytochrome b subunit